MVHAVAMAISNGLINPVSLPMVFEGTSERHRSPHAATPEAGLIYDPLCAACREHGSWRDGTVTW